MLIKKIKANNFKTYLDLDLDITSHPDRPIILIGGANGGGKTTFFDAIYGALYGLNIPNKRVFKELINAGATKSQEPKILLEIHFSGRVLNQEQSYVLTRTYALNPDNKPVESVRLNMNGTIFQYGTATPATQRAEQEAQVNKIIKANLPEELSKYFLFDAMEAGNLLKEDRLNKVIKENIENAMGFNKYLNLAKTASTLTQEYTAQSLELENEKKEYLELIEEKRKLEDVELKKIESDSKKCYQYSIANKELYDNLKAGFNQESNIKKQIDELETELSTTASREKSFRESVNEFTSNIETHICLPKLENAFKAEIALVLKEQSQSTEDGTALSNATLENVLVKAVNYLSNKGYDLKDVSINDVAKNVIKSLKNEAVENQYDFFQLSEIKALESLVNTTYTNPYNSLKQSKTELDIAIETSMRTTEHIEKLKAQISGDDYSILKAYEDNDSRIKQLVEDEKELKKEIKKLDSRIHQFDIPTTEEPDPKFETLKKLQPLFESVANTLLKSKKEQIQARMKEDLNNNLAAYKDVISKVELSEDLKDLNFSIFHKAGNEIYLSQLNTASTQVVIQVLLKSLHEFGDYDPPVMIDTVMGVLDETSRSTLLENYFPELSHQTILLSSDSEIRAGSDLEKIEPFISKAYTLERDKELQKTEVTEGYFNIQID
ncbi:MAG: DNA sulfur modification protein DndD [Flavobacteriaceae bacterium]|nr:DNA sulfur modification protein DndD [Flavobacteriaceae bacterium]|tara:strand:+ start:29369 stop:31366 length:1998 start_codon:yes stop_codon:yes gene_type:complete